MSVLRVAGDRPTAVRDRMAIALRLNHRPARAETLTVPHTGERRLLGLLALPVLVLDVVCALGVAMANDGTARTVLLAILGLCLVLTLLTLTLGPGLTRGPAPVEVPYFESRLPRTVMPPAEPLATTPEPDAPATVFGYDPLPDPALPESSTGPFTQPFGEPALATGWDPRSELPARPDPSADLRPEPAPENSSATATSGPPTRLLVEVARRNQTLVARQLAGLDQLAVSDAGNDPDRVAAISRLEQLAMRLRRNGESLMVMAGEDPDRRIPGATTLSEVLAVTVSEIENGSRVTVSAEVDHGVRPHLALPLVHLFSELLDNATGYAFPAGGVQVRVQAEAQPGADLVRVLIEDSGPGFSAADLETANRSLSDPSISTAEIGSLGLGLFVAGRLARQVPCTVQLAQAVGGGVLITVGLPEGTFVPGTVSQIKITDEAPLPSVVVPDQDEYSFYDDHTDLPDYIGRQGYADRASLEDDRETRPEIPVQELPEPVTLAGPLSLDEPFGANAPIEYPVRAETFEMPPVPEPRRRGHRDGESKTFFDPITASVPVVEGPGLPVGEAIQQNQTYSDSAQQDPAQPEANQLGPNQQGPNRSEPIPVESILVEPVLVEPVQYETAHDDPAQQEPVQGRSAASGPVAPEPVGAFWDEAFQNEPVLSEPVWADPVASGPSAAEAVGALQDKGFQDQPVLSEPVWADPLTSGPPAPVWTAPLTSAPLSPESAEAAWAQEPRTEPIQQEPVQQKPGRGRRVAPEPVAPELIGAAWDTGSQTGSVQPEQSWAAPVQSGPSSSGPTASEPAEGAWVPEPRGESVLSDPVWTEQAQSGAAPGGSATSGPGVPEPTEAAWAQEARVEPVQPEQVWTPTVQGGSFASGPGSSKSVAPEPIEAGRALEPRGEARPDPVTAAQESRPYPTRAQLRRQRQAEEIRAARGTSLQETGPQTTGRQTTGSEGFGLQGTDSNAAGTHAAGTHAAGTHAAGTHAEGALGAGSLGTGSLGTGSLGTGSL
ncbi:ATP-binding protein, partial [Kineosporia mesophila]